MKSVRISADPRRLRARKYMPAGDQLDAIAAGFRAILTAGMPLPSKTIEWVEHCEAVKTRLPKKLPT